jgi:hypothetical protein
MMECQGSYPYHQQSYHPLMQIAPLVARWLVWGLYEEAQTYNNQHPETIVRLIA